MNRITSLLFLLTISPVAAAQEAVPATPIVQPAAETAQPTPEPETEKPNDLVPCPDLKELQSRFKRIHQISLSLTPSDGVLPSDCSDPLFPTSSRGDSIREWAASEFHWAATELSFQPLYFDETPLERYGQTVSPLLQPGLSGVHFFGSFLIMPYKIGVDRLHDRVYTLGYHRPGSPAPCVRQRLPWEVDAATLEAAAIIGVILLLP